MKKRKIYFASNIKAIRQHYRFTFSDLAKSFKISSRQIQNWVYGKSAMPDVPTAVKIINSLPSKNGFKPTLDALFFNDFRYWGK